MSIQDCITSINRPRIESINDLALDYMKDILICKYHS